MNIAHRISHGTNVVVVSILSNSSKKILLFADWLFTTTTFVPWDILWAMDMNEDMTQKRELYLPGGEFGLV